MKTLYPLLLSLILMVMMEMRLEGYRLATASSTHSPPQSPPPQSSPPQSSSSSSASSTVNEQLYLPQPPSPPSEVRASTSLFLLPSSSWCILKGVLIPARLLCISLSMINQAKSWTKRSDIGIGTKRITDSGRVKYCDTGTVINGLDQSNKSHVSSRSSTGQRQSSRSNRRGVKASRLRQPGDSKDNDNKEVTGARPHARIIRRSSSKKITTRDISRKINSSQHVESNIDHNRDTKPQKDSKSYTSKKINRTQHSKSNGGNEKRQKYRRKHRKTIQVTTITGSEYCKDHSSNTISNTKPQEDSRRRKKSTKVTITANSEYSRDYSRLPVHNIRHRNNSNSNNTNSKVRRSTISFLTAGGGKKQKYQYVPLQNDGSLYPLNPCATSSSSSSSSYSSTSGQVFALLSFTVVSANLLINAVANVNNNNNNNNDNNNNNNNNNNNENVSSNLDNNNNDNSIVTGRYLRPCICARDARVLSGITTTTTRKRRKKSIVTNLPPWLTYCILRVVCDGFSITKTNTTITTANTLHPHHLLVGRVTG